MKKADLIKYSTLFIFFFISLVFIYTIFRGDTFVNFGFSYAISKGEIPYKDFNMVITPFAPFLYSLGLLISKNILVYYLEQALLLTVLFYYLNKLIGKKSIIMLLIMIIPYPISIVTTIFPGYNFLLILLFFMFIYYFKNNSNLYLLGLILGIIFCTKQTIGVVLFLPIIYYLFKDRNKFIKILIGYLIPICILIVYLLISNSFMNFIDLCFLGLFSFNKNNNSIDIFYLICYLLGLGYVIYRIIKDKKNLLLYFFLLFNVVAFPIIDYYHVSLFLIIVFYLLLENKEVPNIYYKYIIILIISLSTICTFVTVKIFKDITISNFNNFTFTISDKKYASNSKKLLNYVNSLDKDVIYLMRGSENYYYKIINNQKINYFDLPNYGNYGYNGEKKILKKLKNVHNSYIVLDKSLLVNVDSNQQYIIELGRYITKSSKKIKRIGNYELYYKK